MRFLQTNNIKFLSIEKLSTVSLFSYQHLNWELVCTFAGEAVF